MDRLKIEDDVLVPVVSRSSPIAAYRQNAAQYSAAASAEWVEHVAAREAAVTRESAERLEAKCAPSREERIQRYRFAVEGRAARRARAKWLDEYAAKECTRVVVQEYRRVLCDDGSSFVRVCQQHLGSHTEYRCKKGVPEELTPAGNYPATELILRSDDATLAEDCGDIPPELLAAAVAN